MTLQCAHPKGKQPRTVQVERDQKSETVEFNPDSANKPNLLTVLTDIDFSCTCLLISQMDYKSIFATVRTCAVQISIMARQVVIQGIYITLDVPGQRH